MFWNILRSGHDFKLGEKDAGDPLLGCGIGRVGCLHFLAISRFAPSGSLKVTDSSIRLISVAEVLPMVFSIFNLN